MMTVVSNYFVIIHAVHSLCFRVHSDDVPQVTTFTSARIIQNSDDDGIFFTHTFRNDAILTFSVHAVCSRPLHRVSVKTTNAIFGHNVGI